MDKRLILKKFEEQIAEQLSLLTQAALSAHEAAVHGESKAEDQYDTRGLEASYLASAQSRRAMELEQALALFRHVDIIHFNKSMPIASTALIELECDDKISYYLLMPQRGGMIVTLEGKTIHSITPQSPLGIAVLGRCVGDEIQIEIQKIVRVYEIISVV